MDQTKLFNQTIVRLNDKVWCQYFHMYKGLPLIVLLNADCLVAYQDQRHKVQPNKRSVKIITTLARVLFRM
jgi:hypothetical protein